MNAEFSTDIEDSVEHGSLYMDITREQARLFKANKGLTEEEKSFLN